MSTEITIKGPSAGDFREALEASGFETYAYNDQCDCFAGAIVRMGGRDVGRVTRCPFSEYGIQLEISTGWCSWGNIQEMLERLEAKGRGL